LGDFNQDIEANAWVERVRGFDVVINAVGIIREEGGNRFETLHGKAPIALFQACAQAGVPAVVQISALGTNQTRKEPYFFWRQQADQALLQLPLRGVVIRPSVVYGQGDHSMAFFRSLAALPIVPLVGDGSQRLSPIWVEDLAELVVRAVEGEDRGIIEAVGPEVIPFRALLQRLKHWMGGGKLWAIPVPLGLVGLVAKATDWLKVGPITSAELSMLLSENFAEKQDLLGIKPVVLEEGLGIPSVADSWAARLSILRHIFRASIACIWLATGIICLWAVEPEVRYGMLGKSGFSGPIAEVFLDGLCLTEIPLGLATLWGGRISVYMGLIQLILVSSFSFFLLLTQPAEWLHPYGPLTKNIPLLGATLVMMALEWPVKK
jgi:uncharacterized protein YbjT (DUF2867 family)